MSRSDDRTTGPQPSSHSLLRRLWFFVVMCAFYSTLALGQPITYYRLHVSKLGTGSGTVVSNTGSIDCGTPGGGDLL